MYHSLEAKLYHYFTQFLHESHQLHCTAVEQDEALQDWPVTPELHQQDSHTFSDVTPPTEPSPRESPIPPESSQTHYAPPDHPNQPSHQGHSYGQPDPDHERYPQPQNGYAAPVQTGLNGQTPNGQGYHTGSAPGRSQAQIGLFMCSGSLAGPDVS